MERSSPNRKIIAVAAGGPGLVAAGRDYPDGDADAAVWTSADGRVWSRVPHDEAVFGGGEAQEIIAVAAGGPGLVAVGFDVSGGDLGAAVWTSADGRVWSRVPQDETVLGGGYAQIVAVAARGPGLVAVGYGVSGGETDAAVWVSPLP